MLNRNGRGGGRNIGNKYSALLKGLVRCGSCDVGMIHTYVNKKDRLYRYYVGVKAHQRGWSRFADAKPSELARQLPELKKALEAAQGNDLRLDPRDLYRIKATLAKLDKSTPGYWPAALDLISIISRQEHAPFVPNPPPPTALLMNSANPTLDRISVRLAGTLRGGTIINSWVYFTPETILDDVTGIQILGREQSIANLQNRRRRRGTHWELKYAVNEGPTAVDVTIHDVDCCGLCRAC